MSKREPSEAFKIARTIAKRVSSMTDDERAAFVAKFPAVITIEGHALSGHNAAMALMQRNDVTVVGGFKQWLKAGRCVTKGSTALWIFAPCQSKGDDGEEKLFFRLVPVFDVTQTGEIENEKAA